CSSRRRHTRSKRDWSSDVCSSDLSRVRFERILKAARDVLVDLGFESFTFDEVSKRAEVPIGTLYQFFANKYVLICELDREDTAAKVEERNKFSQNVTALQWPDLIDELIAHLS